MPSPWIARLLLTLLGVQAGLCTAFLADEWLPLRQREEAAFRRVLDTGADLGHVLDPSSPSDRQRVVHPLSPGHPASYLRIDVTNDPHRFFESSPPSPTDWAVILESARSDPPGLAAIDLPLTWENAGEIPLDTLDHQLSLYTHAVLCIDLRRAPVGQPLPDYLRRSAIPLANLTGKPALLPKVNRLVFPPSATGAPNARFGFRLLESEDNSGKMPPAFALWDDLLIPSFPIALAMAQHDVSPAQVHIDLGHSVRLGNGPIIRLDEFGRILLPQDDNGHLLLPKQLTTAFATADSLGSGDLSASFLTGQTPDCILFADATGLDSSPWGNPETLQNIAAAVDILPRPGPAQPHLRFPLWLETTLLLLLATLGAASLRLHPLTRHLLFPLLILSSLALLAALLRFQGSWTPFTPILTAILATWILSTYLHKKLPPPEQPSQSPS